MITTSKAAMYDVYDLIDCDYFVMDIEQELFVVFECIEETDEVTVEDGSMIVRIPYSEMLQSDNATALITQYYLNALEDFDEELYLQVSNRLQQTA